MKKFLTVISLLFLLALSACVTHEQHRGYMTEASRFDKVKTGDTKEEVIAVLGSPSTTATFGEDTWYYISMKTASSAFSTPKVVDQNIVAISFNERGIVEEIKHTSAEDRRNIAISDEETTTEGNSITVMEQLLGNLGRFNAPQQ